MNKLILIPALTLASTGFIHQVHALDFEVDLSRGINNNVFLESDEILRNASSDSEQQSEDIQTQLGIMAAHEFLDQENSDASISLDYFQESFAENDLDTRILNFSLPFNYYQGDYRFRTTYTRTSYELSDAEVLLYNGGRFDIARRFGDNRIGTRFSLINKTPKDERYDGYQGNSSDVKFYVQFRRVDHTIQLDADVFNNDYQDEFIATRGYYLQGSYSQRYTGHDWRVSAKYKNTQYNEDPLYDQIRNDNQISLSYSHNFYVHDKADLYFMSEYTNNASNIEDEDDDFNYNQWVNSVGVRVGF